MTKQKPVREYSDIEEKMVANGKPVRQSVKPERSGFFRGARVASSKVRSTRS